MEDKRYTLTDLTEDEIKGILSERERQKTARFFSNALVVAIILSFVMAVILTQHFHQIFISSACFLPIAAYFLLTYRRNKKVRGIVDRLISQAR